MNLPKQRIVNSNNSIADRINNVLPDNSDKKTGSYNHKSKQPLLFLNGKSPYIKNITLTKAHFLDSYSKAKWNLSEVPCPASFQEANMMVPPESYHEEQRLKTVRLYMDKIQWKDNNFFNKILVKTIKHFLVSGASVSLVAQKAQIIKHKIGLNNTECAREISLDAHTILSKGSFVISNTASDWRTKGNPCVKGYPFIKFYAGIPLVTSFGHVIGVLAIFDQKPHPELTKDNVGYLTMQAKKIMTHLLDNNRSKLDGKKIENEEAFGMDKVLVASDHNNNNMHDLILQIGRATSFRTTLDVIFEKDGSGSSYVPNKRLKLGKTNLNLKKMSQLGSQELANQLLKYIDFKIASHKFCQYLAQKFVFNFVCVAEIRIMQPMKINEKYLPNNKYAFNAENFEYRDKLIAIDNKTIKIRLLGSAGINNAEQKVLDDNGLFYRAFDSDFGIYYLSSLGSKTKFKSGLLMPFSRTARTIVRNNIMSNKKDKIHKSRNNDGKCEKESRDERGNSIVSVMLKSGAYMTCCFSFQEENAPRSDDVISDIFGNCCLFRNLYNVR
ncbi:uncharacterized protein SCODWIG_00405 [Saccharomycodes ludwigii]|uniref:GAF domain-containing protein n=1 Tax=Saccharomycodes ludwigii TaxID=36035 RepID=A0A376B2D3_9ASCO|nr:uncharacterized protein SCODWIG_00405 [Saccharomycodes ludwigii]